MDLFLRVVTLPSLEGRTEGRRFQKIEEQLLPQGSQKPTLVGGHLELYIWNVTLPSLPSFPTLQTEDAVPWGSVCVSLVGQAEAVTVPSAMPPASTAMG